VVCQVRVVLSKYQSNLIINKEVMAILAKFNNLTLNQGQSKNKVNSTCLVQYPHDSKKNFEV